MAETGCGAVLCCPECGSDLRAVGFERRLARVVVERYEGVDTGTGVALVSVGSGGDVDSLDASFVCGGCARELFGPVASALAARV